MVLYSSLLDNSLITSLDPAVEKSKILLISLKAKALSLGSVQFPTKSFLTASTKLDTVLLPERIRANLLLIFCSHNFLERPSFSTL